MPTAVPPSRDPAPVEAGSLTGGGGPPARGADQVSPPALPAASAPGAGSGSRSHGAVPAALPLSEAARQAALNRYAVLDTPPEQAFDDITSIAAALCNAPIALITFVDGSRQWFKAQIGLGDATETPRDVAFCAHAILEPDRILEVNDALEDPRFAHNPLVLEDPSIRFYAGAPLVAPDGHALGTLCVIDRVPRHLSSRERGALGSLARQVVAQLELRHLVADLTLQSTTDALTGVGNRRAFDQRLAHEWSRHIRTSSSLGLLMIDVDHFKVFNDRHGHPEGDQALIQCVHTAQRPLRTIDFLARFGGEEFAVILPEAGLEGAIEAGERVRQAIERASWPRSALTVSVGVAAIAPTPGTDPNALVARADRALYQAKESGRNRVGAFERWN